MLDVRKRASRALALGLSLAADAHASDGEPVTPISVDFGAPAGCPGTQGFVEQLRRRSPRVRVVSEDGNAQSVHVRIERRDGSFVGRLVLAETERVVEGKTCAEVAAGLAFVTALALDARTTATEVAPAPPAEPEVAPVPAPPVPAPPVPAPPTPSPPATTVQEVVPVSEETRPSRAWTIALGVDGRVQSGPTPSVALSAPLFIDVARVTSSLVALRVRARFERTGGSTPGAGAGADFVWTVGTLELCPLEWTSHASARLDLCALG
jgi:hypothetical protein